MIACKCQTIVGYQTEYAYDCNEYHYNFNFDENLHKKYSGFITFDIETSRHKKTEDEYESFMYIWQICVNYDDVIFGRTWEELLNTLNKIRQNANKKIVIYVHNLAYEFQFMKTFFEFENIFAIDEHVILKASNDFFEFRCSYKLSNMSLKKFIENTPKHYFIKGIGDLDYSVLRTPQTPLNAFEYGYIHNDVKGLYHSIMHLLEDDTLDTIPLTSTGYVRKECRKATRNNEDRKTFKKSIINIETYNLLKECFRGGNTASSRFFTNQIINDVQSYDISSSYPYVMMSEYFPFGKFKKATILYIDELEYYNDKYCTIGTYTFTNVKLKKNIPIPYISHSKCKKISSDSICYNGRVIECDFLTTSLTNIDFEIINDMYTYDDIVIENFMFSNKKKISKNLRKVIYKYFEDKTLLKGNEEEYYFYMKQKNKLNSIYGMFVSAIIRDVYEYDSVENKINKNEVDNYEMKKQMDKYNTSRNSFLNYQIGVFVTAYARKRLQELINIIGIDVVYVDTDSVKFIGNYDKEIKKINNEIINQVHDVPINVNDVYMGIWDIETPYEEFITLGAKKYAYIQNGKIGLTVSGLNKQKAPLELEKKGGLKAFKRNTIFYDSGRTTVEYKHEGIHILNIGNEKIVTGSYINMFDTTYTLGITDTMLNIIEQEKSIDTIKK